MTFKQAIEILAQPHPSHPQWYQAVQVVELAVLSESQRGDPDSSLQDWIGDGDYDGNETVKQITQEWDEL